MINKKILIVSKTKINKKPFIKKLKTIYNLE